MQKSDKFKEWCEVFERTGNASLACRETGVSKGNVKSWKKKYFDLKNDPSKNPDRQNYLTWLKEVAFSPDGSSADRRLYAEMMGWAKKGSNGTSEVSSGDRVKWAIGVRESFKREREESGMCPFSGEPCPLCVKSRLDTEPEREPGGEMATVALSD